MSRWKLFRKSKPKEDEITESEETTEETEGEIEIDQLLEDQPLAEYHETLYTGGPSSKTGTIVSSDQRIWRDVDTIESNIDNLHITKAIKPHSEVEKTVDKLIEKRMINSQKSVSTRKPSNVIYVVSKPQPGQVRGDWAVRSHRKIYSHHRKKETAIHEARKIATERNATVMVQNINGTFSVGFKPRKKK